MVRGQEAAPPFSLIVIFYYLFIYFMGQQAMAGDATDYIVPLCYVLMIGNVQM